MPLAQFINTLMRLDEYILKKEYTLSIEKARDIILAGMVLVNGSTLRQKTYRVLDTDTVSLVACTPHVSRGYDKLDFAIKNFNIDIREEIALDIGSSTGGFTECLLEHGVKKVYALDVGHNQLVYKLRKDSRVVSIENTNAKDIKPSMFDELPSIVVSDVSFISISKIAPVIKSQLPNIKFWLSLVKPQFEARRSEVGAGGIIRDDKLRDDIVEQAINRVVELGFLLSNKTTSPIKGTKGNIEYLALFNINS